MTGAHHPDPAARQAAPPISMDAPAAQSQIIEKVNAAFDERPSRLASRAPRSAIWPLFIEDSPLAVRLVESPRLPLSYANFTSRL